MSAIKRILTLSFIPANKDLGLLIIRIGVSLTLFLKHGMPKVMNFSQMSAHFPNPVHIGSEPSLVFALFADAICSILVTLGLFTRWAALIIFINLFTVMSLVEHFSFFGQGAPNTEFVALFVFVNLGLIFSGAGRYSIDHSLESR
jgi:putative oxidoreductase